MNVLNSGPSQPKLRSRAVPALTVALAALIAVVGAVFADAPDPKPEQARVRVGDVFIVNGVQAVRVSVSGGWQWPTHHSDCNTDRTGAGYAVDWGDPNQSGNHVTTLNGVGSIDVGAASGNAYNPFDNEVHPTRPEAAGSLFNDPGSPSQYAQWRGGCGTYNGQYNTGVWGAVDLGSGQPVLCTSANSPSPTCLGGSHVYTLAAIQQGVTICSIMYDVHGQDSDDGGAPSKQKETTAGGNDHNGDNGAEKNDNTPLGNTCAPIPVPTPSSSPTPSPTPSGTPPQTATPTPPQTATPTPPQTSTPTPPQTPTPTPTSTPPHDLRCPVGTSRLIIQGTFDATYTDGTFVVSVNFRNSGQLEDFSSNLGVQELLVDGNGGTNRYQFNPPITFGSNFAEPGHGVINQTAFCYIRPGQTPTPPQTPTPTPPQTATPTPPQTATPTPPQTPTPTPSLPTPTPGQPASISGNVCLANNSFTNCPANGPISGVTIQLFNANTAQLVAQTQTDGNGHYVMSNIPAGSYYLHEIQPGGPLDQGGCFVGTAGGFCTPVDLILGINLGSGVNATGYNFSEIPGTPISPTRTPPLTPSPTPPVTPSPTPPATPSPTPSATPGQFTLSGCVYSANDAVTLFPGTGPISGVQLVLFNSNSLAIVGSAITSADGCYSISNVPNGSYILREFQPNGYNQGGCFPGNAGGACIPVDLMIGIQINNGNAVNYNFSEIPQGNQTPTPPATPSPTPPATPSPTPSATPGQGTLNGCVYTALDASALFPGTGPISGVTIHLLNSNTLAVVGSAITSANGCYSISNIPDGSYIVREFQPGGYNQGGIFPCNGAGSAAPVDLILGVNFGGGNVVSGCNFSEIVPGPTPSPTPPCTCQTPTPTPSPTPPATPTPSPTPSASPSPSPTPSPSPCSCQTPQPNGSISGHVYQAGNALTVFPGNGPIAGVTIELHRSSDGLLLAIVETDANGNYTLPNVAAGAYFLHEVQPNGFNQGGIFPGNAGGSASSVDLILGINLGAGVNASNYNFSEIPNGGSTPTPSSTPANPTPTPTATPNTTTCLTNRPDLTMVEISNSALVSLLINGNGDFGDGTVAINVNNFNGHTFNWSSNIGITSVFARTATGGALFEYNPTVVAANGIGTTTSITFLSFCYTVGGGNPTPTPPNNPTPTPTLPDTTVAAAAAASTSTGGALLAGALIMVLAAALALGSGWRRNRRTVKATVKPMWSTGSRN